jgi:hypothetical protein
MDRRSCRAVRPSGGFRRHSASPRAKSSRNPLIIKKLHLEFRVEICFSHPLGKPHPPPRNCDHAVLNCVIGALNCDNRVLNCSIGVPNSEVGALNRARPVRRCGVAASSSAVGAQSRVIAGPRWGEGVCEVGVINNFHPEFRVEISRNQWVVMISRVREVCAWTGAASTRGRCRG